MAEYPVHNYGSNPLGQFGMQMLQSSLDWDEKQKLLEQQALREAVKSEREGYMKTVEAGTAPSGSAGRFFSDPNVAAGMEGMNQQNRTLNYVKQLQETAKLSKDQQEYKGKETDNAMKLWETWAKRKDEKILLGQDVTYENDQLKVIGESLTKLTGLEYNPVKMDVSEIKKAKEDVFIKQISDLESSAIDAAAKGDLEGYSKAIAALGSAVTTASKTLRVPATQFASAMKTLEQGAQEIPKMLAEKVKGPSSVSVGTIQTIDNPDGTQTQQRFMGMKDGQQIWQKVGSGPKFKPEREGLTPSQTANISHQLRGELQRDPYVKDYKDVSQKFQVMEEALKSSTDKDTKSMVAVDQALITLFNKMTDPQSVVRESEYARTSSDQAVINRIKGKAYKILDGGAGLTSVERNELVKMGKRFYDSYTQNYDHVVGQYGILASQNGIDPSLVVGPYKRRDSSGTTSGKTSTPKTAQDYLKKLGGR